MNPDLEREINAVETRIARERGALAVIATQGARRAREGVASAPVLLGVAAVGYVAGRLLERPVRTPRPRGRFAGVIGSLLWSWVQIRYGSPLELLARLRTSRSSRPERQGFADSSPRATRPPFTGL